jgi:hypothetical protein
MGEIPLAMLLIAALYWLVQTAINWVCSPTTNCTIVSSKLELHYAAGFDLPDPVASFFDVLVNLLFRTIGLLAALSPAARAASIDLMRDREWNRISWGGDQPHYGVGAWTG